MNSKHRILPLLAILSIFLFVGLVSAAANDTTIRDPSADSRLTGASQILNSTIETALEAYNMTWGYNQTSVTLIEIGVVANTSVAQDEFNRTWDTTALINGRDFCINATSRNFANEVISSALVCGLWIDNGKPTASLNSSTFSNNLALVIDTEFSVALTDDDTLGISNCTVFFTEDDGSAVTSVAVSAIGNGCILTTTPTAQSLSANSDYTTLMMATDANSNKTNSSSRTLRVTVTNAGGGGGGVVSGVQTILDADSGDVAEAVKEGFMTRFFQSIADWFRNIFGSGVN